MRSSGTLLCVQVLAVSLLASACGGSIELDPDPPVRADTPSPMPEAEPTPGIMPKPAPVPPGKLEVMPTDIDDPIAQAICKDVATYETSGTFTADWYFGVSDATSVSAVLHQYQPADSKDGVSGITLVFHTPAQRGEDMMHGAYVGVTEHHLRLSASATYPEIPTGTFDDAEILQLGHRSVCYADALGSAADEPWDGAKIEHTKTTITKVSDSLIEGTILSKDGTHRLDFRAPIAAAGFPKQGPICCFGETIKPGTPPKLAPACVTKPTGTFSADPSFGFAAGTKLEVYVDKRYFSDHFGAFLRFELRSPSTDGKDVYGDIRHRRRTTLTAPLDAGYPTMKPGTYAASVTEDEEDEACYVNGLGYGTSLPSSNLFGDGSVTITSQTDTEIAGVLLIGTRKLEFKTPITPTPADVPLGPSCCRE